MTLALGCKYYIATQSHKHSTWTSSTAFFMGILRMVEGQVLEVRAHVKTAPRLAPELQGVVLKFGFPSSGPLKRRDPEL